MSRLVIGDVVEYVGESSFWTKGAKHIIAECHYTDGIKSYATNRGAWFGDKDFKLISEATRESLAQLEENLNEDEEIDYD
jgi:hypothetical protein